jgi:hypothetical protein
MSSEWMKVMLEEIARKKAEEAQGRAELERRQAPEPARPPQPGETPPDP